MVSMFRLVLFVSTLLAGIGGANAQQVSDPRVADLVQAGQVRIGLMSTQYTKNPATGELKGVRVDIGRALAGRLGVKAIMLELGSPLDVVQCIRTRACDMAFLPMDDRGAGIADFSYPLIQSEYTMLVPAGSAIRSNADADKPGIRIAGVRSHGSAAALRSVIRNAEIVLEDELAAFESLRAGHVHAFASSRAFLLRMSAGLPGSQVLPDRYGAQLNRVAIPKGQAGWLAYANEFVEEAKASGLIQKAIDAERTSAFQVAPPGNSK